jgi:hypothetical protein
VFSFIQRFYRLLISFNLKMHLIIKALLGVATVSAAKKYVMEGSPCRKVSKEPKTSLIKEPLKPVKDLPD